MVYTRQCILVKETSAQEEDMGSSSSSLPAAGLIMYRFGQGKKDFGDMCGVFSVPNDSRHRARVHD